MKNLCKLLIVLFILSSSISFTYANFFLGVRSGSYFNNFWAAYSVYEETDEDDDKGKVRRLYNTYNGFFVGLDISYKLMEATELKGSRLYISSDICYYFISMSGYFIDYMEKPFPPNISSSLSLSLYLNGTVPRTDVLWGLGSLFFFVFPNYVDGKIYDQINERFYFFAVPNIMIGYEILFENGQKISPQLRLGVNLNPYFSKDVRGNIIDSQNVIAGDGESHYYKMAGFYIDLSICYYFKLF